MMIRLLDAGARRLRPAIGWTAFVLVMLAVGAGVLGVVAAEWVEGDELLLHTAMAGALLGMLLAHTAMRAQWAALISVGGGLLYVGQSLARFIPPPLGAMAELARGAEWLWLRLWRPDLAPPALPVWSESGTRLFTLGERLASWVNTMSGGQSEQNPVAFLFVSGLILWGSATWAAWITVRRGRALLAMLPMGLALSMSTYLSDVSISYVIVYAGCVLLLLPLLNLAWQERRWDRTGIDYSTEIRFDVWQVAVLVVIAALLLALITPSLSIPSLLNAFWKIASRPLERLEEFVFRFFGNVEPVSQPEIPVPGEKGRAAGSPSASLPRAHLLGGDGERHNQVVMVVCTDGPAPPPEELLMQGLAKPGPKHYWKGITYDVYTGQRWANGMSTAVEISAHQPVILSTVTPTLQLRQRFLIQAPHGTTLYAAAEAKSVDQQIASRRRTESDLVGLEGRTEDYVVYSDVPQASARQLVAQSPAQISATHPSYIVDRYLRLPADLPERVHTLADEIVSGIDSTYDQAVAIERYLRQFPYDLDVTTPPPGRDVVDYFLFDAQRGYCDYYASAFVVLARSVGIPARLAIGYTMGAYDTDLGCYVVAERSAHSWPEVYFSERGWIAFEPTGAYETLARPDDPIRSNVPSPAVQPPPERPLDVVLHEWWRRVRRMDRNELLSIAGIAAGAAATALLLVYAIARGIRSHHRRTLSPVQGIALCYAEMTQLGEQLGAARRPQDTPAEYARTLSAVVQARVARWPWSDQDLMPRQAQAVEDANRLSQAYQRASYYPQSVTREQRTHVDRQWQQLQREMRRLVYASLDKSRK